MKSRATKLVLAMLLVGAGLTLGVTMMWAESPRSAHLKMPNESQPVSIHDVIVRPAPDRPYTEMVAPDGSSTMVSCQLCHANKESNITRMETTSLSDFHVGLQFNHGSLRCADCHTPGNYDTLHLANGEEIEYRDVMQLCSQCHGTQARDYENGAHGGMSGYWDLSAGPRTRNQCVHCHAPHVPAFGEVIPASPPADRFRPTLHHSSEKNHE